MGKIKVYLAGPYTFPKGEEQENVNRMIDYAQQIPDKFWVYIPLLIHYIQIRHPKSYKYCMQYEQVAIDVCDCLLRMSGESKGADEEIKYIKKQGKPVFYSVEELEEYYNC